MNMGFPIFYCDLTENYTIMGKGQDAKKATKKEPQKTTKEKRAEKKAAKKDKKY